MRSRRRPFSTAPPNEGVALPSNARAPSDRRYLGGGVALRARPAYTRLMLAFAFCLVAAAHAADWPDLSRPPAGTTKDLAGDVALIVAVEDYAFLPGVPGALAKARDWEAYFRARGATVKTMLDGEAVQMDRTGSVQARAAQFRRSAPL